MEPWLVKFMKPKDLDDVAQSVLEAEKLTSAEICPMVVRSSSTVGYIAPLIFLMSLCLCLLCIDIFSVPVFNYDKWGLGYLAIVFICLIIAKTFSVLPPIQRFFLIYQDTIIQVHRRAESEFYLHKLYMTSNRSGILLMVSLLEKKVVVLADETIAKSLPKNTWDDLIKLVVEQIKKDNLSSGLVLGVSHMSQLLKDKFPIQLSDKNELSDKLIIKE